MKDQEWAEIKLRGSDHYKTSGAQLIDVIRDMKPHPDLTVLDIVALFCDAKYALRQLQRGKAESDCDKISHYTDMVKWGM